MHLIASCTRNSPRFKSPNKNPKKKKAKTWNLQNFAIYKRTINPQLQLQHTIINMKKIKKKTSSFERVHLHYFPDPVLNIGGESKSNLRGQIGDAHALCSDLNRLVGHDTHLLPNQKKKQTFFVSKKLPHLIESKPATVYSLILVERTEKSEARGQQQYLHCGEAAGGDGPRRFPAAAARVGWGIWGRQTLLGLGGLYRLLRPVRVGRNSVYRVIDS